jgi:hypothetical protein
MLSAILLPNNMADMRYALLICFLGLCSLTTYAQKLALKELPALQLRTGTASFRAAGSS